MDERGLDREPQGGETEMRVEAFPLPLLQRPDPKEGGGQPGMADLPPTTHCEIYIFVLLCPKRWMGLSPFYR